MYIALHLSKGVSTKINQTIVGIMKLNRDKAYQFQIIMWISGIVLFSCSSDDYPSSIDLSKNQTVSVFDVFSDVKAIQLETSEYFLINQIRRIVYYDDRYYILDERSQQIFCFDKYGQFVFKIDSQGKGPGEYHLITDIAIDQNNNQLIVLDPVVQRVHFFDLEGGFLSSRNIKDDKVLALNRVYPMGDTLLLLISITDENLLFYSLKEDKIVYSNYAYDVPSTLHAFAPRDNVYFFDNEIYFSPPLSSGIVNLTKIYPEPYFTWHFGPDNNSDRQISRLLEEIKTKQNMRENISFPYQTVGKNKILHHYILKSFENGRFRIAAVEFDDDFKFVVIDKKMDKTLIFNSLNEDIRLPYQYMQSDRAIAFYTPEFEPREISMIEREGLQDYVFKRNHLLYTPEILHEDCRKILENHDPMKDNPYLVIYTFKQ